MPLESETAEAIVVNTTPTNWTLIIIIAVAVLALAGAAAYFFFERMPKKSFSLLQNTQVTLDVLDGPALFSWAKEVQVLPAMQRVVAYANKRWITKLGYQYPEGIDDRHNVIAFIVDQASGESSHERLFSFSEMSDAVQKLFGSEDCFFLKN